MKNTFNPTVFKNKNTIYVKVNGFQGICKIYDWDKSKQRYLARNIGLKYYAHKKISGIQKQKCFEIFEEAKSWRNNNSLFDIPETNQDILFKDIMSEFFNDSRSRIQITTLEKYKVNSKHLEFFFGFPMKLINSQAIDEWLRKVKQPEYLRLQHKTRLTYGNELRMLRLIFKHYSEYYSESYVMPIKERHLINSIIDQEKYKLAKAKNATRFIPREIAELWLNEMLLRGQSDQSKMVYGILALFQLRSGVRIGEACALSWTDIDLEINQVCISKSVQWAKTKERKTRISHLTKNGESRIIFIPKQVVVILKTWKTFCIDAKGLIFTENGVDPLSYRNVQYNYNWAFKKLGLEWSSTHILRHTYATSFLESTHNQLALSRQLGHKSLKQTEHYAKITSTLVSDGVKDFEKSLSKPNVISFESFKACKNEVKLGEAGNLKEEQSDLNSNLLTVMGNNN